MDIHPALDWSLIRTIIISMAIGGLIGLERQSRHEPGHSTSAVGVRTFSLSALLGTLTVLAADVAPAVPYIAGVGYLLLVVTFLFFEFQVREEMPGITTEVSALLVYVLGALVPSKPVFAAVIAVLVAGLLSIKDWTHEIVDNLTDEEVFGTIQFLLISVVLLPLLPSEPVDPWGWYNLQELWFLVVLISGISFAGYFAIRFMGRERGIALTGALGGLASSTAVTMAMCQKAENATDDSVNYAAAFAILIASGIMTARVLLIVLAVSTTLAGAVWIPLAAMAVPGVGVAWFFWRRIAEGESEPRDPADAEDEDELPSHLEISNPFELAPALKFGLLFVVIIGVVNLAKQFFGSSGTYVASFLSGLANMDAISIAVGRMVEAGDIASLIGVRGVVIAVLANSLTKVIMSFVLGSRRLGLYVMLGLLPMATVGMIVVFVM